MTAAQAFVHISGINFVGAFFFAAIKYGSIKIPTEFAKHLCAAEARAF